MVKNNNKKGLTASEIKYIAILAMLIDHIARLFVVTDSVAGQIMHFIGRTTAPVMCFFISEGYHHTRNVKKYFIRLGIFAVISHFAYAFCFNGGFFERGTESMISTLFLCLLSVYIYNSKSINICLKLPLIMFIAFFADYCDWGSDAILFTMAFEIGRSGEHKHSDLAGYSLAAVVYLLPTAISIVKYPSFISYNIHKLGVFLPVLLLWLYNGEKAAVNMINGCSIYSIPHISCFLAI